MASSCIAQELAQYEAKVAGSRQPSEVKAVAAEAHDPVAAIWLLQVCAKSMLAAALP